MEKIQDYYVYLGLPESAGADEIRRTIIRMRRNCQEDVEKYSLLQEIQDTLCDESKRKQYDIHLQYGNQLEHIQEKIHSSETEGEREKNLKEAKKLYTKVLQSDQDNVDALWNLVEIEERLNNENQAVIYLKRLEKIVEREDKPEVLHRLGEIFKKQDKTEEAIRCFDAIYNIDAAYVEDISMLARLYNEKKDNIKEAIRILDDCINRCEDSGLKIAYLCEMLRAILFRNQEKYKKIEEVIYKKLERFRSDIKEKNLANAAAMLVAIANLDDEKIKDKAWFYRFEQIYLSFGIEDLELNKGFEILRQTIKLEEAGKIHEAIELYTKDVWTDELREKLSEIIAKDAAGIEESLHYIKETAPLFWNAVTGLEEFEKIVADNLPYSNEMAEIEKDPKISLDLRMMLELLMLNIFVDFEKIKSPFCKARDNFFDEEEKTKVQYSLERLEEYYPSSYKRIADIFFEGKSTVEVLESRAASKEENHDAASKEENRDASSKVYYPNAAEEYIHKPYLSGFWELLLIVIATCCLPPALPVIFFVKYYHRHQKKISKVWKVMKPIFIAGVIAVSAVWIYGIASSIWEYIEHKNKISYKESHNFLLTDEELQKRNKLDEKYQKKTDMDIHVIQANPYNPVDFPEGNYIWLVIWNYGYQTTCELKSNYLSVDDTNLLMADIKKLYQSETEDYEKCKQFYELAYRYQKTSDVGLNNIYKEENEADAKIDVENSGINSSLDEERLAEVNSYEYGWEIDMNVIFWEMSQNAAIENIESDLDISCKYKDDGKSREAYFLTYYGDIYGLMIYKMDYDTKECVFSWDTAYALNEEDICRILNVTRVSEREENVQVFDWRNKMQITVTYYPDSCHMIFELY